MTRRVQTGRIAFFGMLSFALSACQTVGVPKVADLMKSPEFSEDAANIGADYPDVSEAPTVPTDIRSARQWDKDAQALQALRGKGTSVKDVRPLTEAEATAQYEALEAKAQAYKKDDPTSGPVQGFPKYKPRR